VSSTVPSPSSGRRRIARAVLRRQRGERAARVDEIERTVAAAGD